MKPSHAISLPIRLDDPNRPLIWHCEPRQWSLSNDAAVLSVTPDANTDFWQRTHHDFQADNGHFFYASVKGAFRMSVKVRIVPVHQYDQAGLMVRFSPDCWLKTSIELEPGSMSRLGAVVTNSGYSDWSTQDVPADTTEYWLRVDREGSTYIVAASSDGVTWTQLRVAHLLEDDGSGAVMAGMYACCPKGAGLTAEFRSFYIEQPGWDEIGSPERRNFS